MWMVSKTKLSEVAKRFLFEERNYKSEVWWRRMSGQRTEVFPKGYVGYSDALLESANYLTPFLL